MTPYVMRAAPRKYTYYMNNRVQACIDDAIDAAGGIVDLLPDVWHVPPYRPGSNKRRRYLGGSMVGRKCNRANWYAFHWVGHPTFEPRMLRLFDRGHREEERFVHWLRMIGAEVEPNDPTTIPVLWYHAESDSYVCELAGNEEANRRLAEQGLDEVTGTYHEWIARNRGVKIPEPRQFSWEAFDGHHKGNSDGRARNLPDQELWGLRPDEWVLTEFKTHAYDQFQKLITSAVFKAKPEHWAQMQRYMEKLGLKLALYGAVNKDDDAIYWEYVPYDPTALVQFDANVKEAIYSLKPPPRISNSPSWFDCKYCDWRPQCHFGAPVERNCRTCEMSRPDTGGNWLCTRWGKQIPHDAEREGCAAYTQFKD